MSAPAAPRRTPMARRLVLATLARITDGSLEVRDRHGTLRLGDPSRGPAASIEIREPSAYGDILRRGALGAGEAYAEGKWTADDLVAALRVLLRNRPALQAMDAGPARLARLALRAADLVRANTRRGSRRNIAAHYDLGNAFFALFLDETLTYSCGIFEPEDVSLANASRAKYERICRRLGLGPGHHLLEIGCGWGGFAEHAAARHGCQVTATTISKEQHAHATDRIRRAGLADRVTILDRDYRDLEGRYDRVVSIEMIEAVGHRFLPTYLRTIRDRLEDDGLALVQAITIRDDRYDRARRQVDFIKRHIFPGSFIPSVAAIASAAARSTDLRIVGLEDIGPHYARTLALWRERFLARLPEARALGHAESFLRGWDYYLAYCEAGFREGDLGDAQIVFAARAARRGPDRPGGGSPA